MLTKKDAKSARKHRSSILGRENASPENIDCYNVENDPKGLEYRGFQNVSVVGFVCQKWSSQTPNTHDMTQEK